MLKRVPKVSKPPDCFWTVLKQNARENAVPELRVFFLNKVVFENMEKM